RIEQRSHSLARQQLAARAVLVSRRLLADDRNRGHLLLEVLDQRLDALRARAELGRARVEPAFDRDPGSASERPIPYRWPSAERVSSWLLIALMARQACGRSPCAGCRSRLRRSA